MPHTPSSSSGRRPSVRRCPACGSTWFREVMLNRFAEAASPEPAGRMPMTVLVCLCGAPLWTRLGGVRGGRTPNVEVGLWEHSIERTLNALAAEGAERQALSAECAAEFAARAQIEAASSALKGLESAVGRLLARRDPQRSKRGDRWSLPERKPATDGKDQIVRALQQRGFTFRKSQELVRKFWEVIREALRAGRQVATPLGTFHVALSPRSRARWRFGRTQVVFRRRWKIVFKPNKELEL